MSRHLAALDERADNIRVLIADDHELIRTGLQNLMDAQDDITVTGTASDGRVAVEMTSSQLPDLVLMDLDMPVLDGVRATEEILRRTPGVRVLAFTGCSDEGLVEAALQAGACGCASKWNGCDDLLDSVRQAMASPRS